MDINNLSSSIEEFFTPEEYAAIPAYERKHLLSLRQNYEALKKCGLNANPPEFMVKMKKKVNSRQPAKRCQSPSTESSDDSDAEWTPASEHRKENKSCFVLPRFLAPKPNPVKVASQSSMPRKRCIKAKIQTTSPQEPIKGNRYPLRNKEMVKYMSLAVPDEDDFLYCEECNIEYPCDCPVHGPLLVVEDKEVPEKMRQPEDPNHCYMSLPEGLEIKPSKIDNAGLGVFATVHFPSRTRFGPYKGTKERNEDIAHSSGYCWQIHQDGKPSHFVDARDPCHSNWMRFVNCARCEDEQCLTAYQHEGEIYYRAHQDIPPGTELLVYYGDSYAEELSISIQKVGNFKRQSRKKIPDDDVYPCTKCRLSFSTSVFLERHLHRLHNDVYWEWKNSIHKGDNGCHSIKDNHYPGMTSRICSDGSESIGERSSVTGEELTCDACGKQFCDQLSLQDHMAVRCGSVKRYSGERPYKCSVCSKAFSGSGNLQTHMRIHSGERPYKCSVCSKAFSRSGNLQRHMRIHSGEKPYKCSVCSKAFSRSGDLQTHMRIHSGEKPYKCSVCSKAFNRSGPLQTHMRIHSGEKPYKCSVCSKAFSDSGNLRKHMRIHSGEKPYKCSVCSKAFNRSGPLQTHMRIHSGEKPYKCSVCSKAFSRSGDLQTHMRIHSGEKPYKCSVCSKAFSASGHLQTHMRIHSGEKPYKCSVCSKAFNQSGPLQRHMRIHSGEKPYKCSVCSKAFNQSGPLRKHMRIHSGEKPYKCSVCSKAFSDSGNLRKHMRIHSGINKEKVS